VCRHDLVVALVAGGQMRQSAIIRQSRRNPVGLLVGIAVLVLPFALNGHTKGLVIAGIVWVVVLALLVRWWRGRNDPTKPPTHAV
jgi:O-antigen/teichoic acid export membrane protein